MESFPSPPGLRKPARGGGGAGPYEDDFRAAPFSPDFVRHLPGGYAQKHPDDDWAETFGVWMTPGLDWAGLYADAPGVGSRPTQPRS